MLYGCYPFDPNDRGWMQKAINGDYALPLNVSFPLQQLPAFFCAPSVEASHVCMRVKADWRLLFIDLPCSAIMVSAPIISGVAL
jgi:hypothetical protein